MSIRLGIIGSGGIGQVHAQAASDAGHAAKVLCDLDADRAAEAAKPWRAEAMTDVDAMLARDDLDAIVVALPNCLHAPMACRALAAGKNVLLEKPMAMSVSECEDVISARDAAARLLQVGFVCRFAATVQAARRFIEAGRLGRIYHVRAAMYRRRGIPGLGRWFTTREQSGGGVMIDLGPHLVDLALHLVDRPEVVSANAVATSIFGSPVYEYRFTNMWAGPPNPEGTFDVEDGASVMLRCADGLTVSLEMAWASHLPDGTLPDGVTLFGEKGAMHFDIWGDHLVIGTEMDGELVDVKHTIPEGEGWGTAFRRQHENFAANCSSGTAPAATAEHGRSVQAVLEAMYASVAAGTTVTVGEAVGA
ncbi:MAG: Gfo/Idh/MocA family oxidoreductase [Phycisphaerales bacterium]|nr:Gfo/Idh/MocA family oxidoreductase [Phycisphaerales bacterium]